MTLCVCKVCKAYLYGHYLTIVKFIYSENGTKFCEISTFCFFVCTVDKSKVQILRFVAFSEWTLWINIFVFSKKTKCHPLLVRWWQLHRTIKIHPFLVSLFAVPRLAIAFLHNAACVASLCQAKAIHCTL